MVVSALADPTVSKTCCLRENKKQKEKTPNILWGKNPTLFLRLDQMLQLLDAAKDLTETLAIRYMALNGLSPMEVAAARIEHLDPVEGMLFLPRRHWKQNCICDIDGETIRLQIIYSGGRRKGPLLRSVRKGHFTRFGGHGLVKRVALRTAIPDREKVCPLILKRTFARVYLKTPGNNIGSLQKQFSHKHLWSTARYLRFLIEDVKENHARMMERVKHAEAERVRLVS